jgi:hypothetical protein
MSQEIAFTAVGECAASALMVIMPCIIFFMLVVYPLFPDSNIEGNSIASAIVLVGIMGVVIGILQVICELVVG